MARIPSDQIESIKSDISLLRLVESQGYQPKKQGKDYVMCCPFHEEDTPSLLITPAKNLFHCFGCGAAGTVIDWVMKTRGVSFRHAVEILSSDTPSLAADGGAKPVKRSRAQQLPSPVTLEADAQQQLNQVIAYYHETLLQSPEALAYLQQRGLDHPELIARFQLGYANRTLGYRLPGKHTQAGKAVREQLQVVGLLRSSGHEHFNGSLVVPVFNAAGDVVEVYGRKTRDDLRKGTPKHLYLPGPHAGVWNASGLAGCEEVILCEALLDAMTFWVHGFTHVTASYGTGGFTDEHLSLLLQSNIKRVLIAYDRDEAGNTAAEQVASTLTQAGIDCFRVLLPKGMDVNAYALTMSPDDKALGLVIRKAQWLGQGKAPASPLDTAHTAAQTRLSAAANEETVEAADTVAEDRLPLAAIPEPSTVSPIPPLPSSPVAAEISETDIRFTFGDRTYRVRGLDKNTTLAQLKVTVRVNRDDLFHLDTVDLYSARHRQSFIKQAAVELGVKDTVIKTDVGKVLGKLEDLQEQQLKETLSPEAKPVELTESDKQQALALLQSPDLLTRILDDFNRAGVVGEETNKLVGYLACVSRQLDKPLAVIIQSTSAAGKSSLMDAILNLMPEEARVQYSAMTGQSLFYMGQTNLKHKILAIAEEEGASNASYALKLLQSDGEVTIASTGKDDSTGNLVTKEYTVEGPVMLFLTTTAIDIDEELLNRCVVLTVNESRAQTAAIHAMQRSRQTLAGLLAQDDTRHLIQTHRNAQRLLQPLRVANPFADQLTFLDDKTRTRRDHMKYLTLIQAIALLHQYQRPIHTINHQGQTLHYVEVIPDDIKTANRLAHEVLGRTLDELPPQTRQLLKHIDALVSDQCQRRGMARQDYRFSRRDIRAATGWSDGQLKIHCYRLTELEYLLVHRGGRGQRLVYELLYDGDPDSEAHHLMGLMDPDTLHYDDKKSGTDAQKTGPSQAQVSPKSGGCQGDENTTIKGLASPNCVNRENSPSAPNQNSESYRSQGGGCVHGADTGGARDRAEVSA